MDVAVVECRHGGCRFTGVSELEVAEVGCHKSESRMPGQSLLSSPGLASKSAVG